MTSFEIRRERQSAGIISYTSRVSSANIMSSDEEEEVYLQQGKDEPEAFSLVDANRAKKVQERFCLPHEPACVLTKANKRIEFGKLKGGRLYKL